MKIAVNNAFCVIHLNYLVSQLYNLLFTGFNIRKLKPEGCTFAFCTFNTEVGFVEGEDFLNDGESQTCTFGRTSHI